MNRLAAILGLGLLGSNASLAGDVLYTAWEDDNLQIWIVIQNEMDRKIHIERISLVFYDQKGEPIKEHKEQCDENCDLRPHDRMEFGPYRYPENSKICRVRYVKYRVE